MWLKVVRVLVSFEICDCLYTGWLQSIWHRWTASLLVSCGNRKNFSAFSQLSVKHLNLRRLWTLFFLNKVGWWFFSFGFYVLGSLWKLNLVLSSLWSWIWTLFLNLVFLELHSWFGDFSNGFLWMRYMHFVLGSLWSLFLVLMNFTNHLAGYSLQSFPQITLKSAKSLVASLPSWSMTGCPKFFSPQ